MATLSLYVDNEDLAGAWDTTGSTPYLDAQDQPTNYISDNDRNNDSGTYSFAGTAETGTINSVTLYLYVYGVAASNFAAILSGNNLGDSARAGSWNWVTKDVSAVLDTWEKINAATLLLDRPNTQDEAGCDCAYLYIDYTGVTANEQGVAGVLVMSGTVAKQSVFHRTIAGAITFVARVVKATTKRVGA